MTTCMMDSCSVTNNSTEARATRDKNNVETNNLTKEPNEKKNYPGILSNMPFSILRDFPFVGQPRPARASRPGTSPGPLRTCAPTDHAPARHPGSGAPVAQRAHLYVEACHISLRSIIIHTARSFLLGSVQTGQAAPPACLYGAVKCPH